MKRCAVICCAAAILALPLVAMAADDQPEATMHKKKGKVIAEAKIADSAVVKAIDMKTRTVTLTLSDGTDHTFVVDRKVKKLDQVKVGDVVKARYMEAVTVRLKKTKSAPSVSAGQAVSRDVKSVKPSGAVTQQITAIATIEKFLDDGKAVALLLPDGTTVEAIVRDPENRAKIKKGEIKVGDQIEITYTQALAISVEKAPQK
jgi:hypothetical protein